MSYLVLARKWRPQNFDETVGQEHVLRALTNALESERLHHAYLFAGTRGVGKTTIARILAKALNCEKGITSDPCGKCSSCEEITEGRFVDLIEVDAASKTKVDDTRELLDNVQYAPARGRFKVYLIDEVHMLSKSSFNALLKTLEEPPAHVKFLLATTDPQKLPITVLSRCLQFNLKRLTPTLIQEQICKICEAEAVKAESAALDMIAHAADGSLRDALSLLDQAIAFCGGEVLEQLVEVMLGTIDRKYIGRILDLLAQDDAAEIMSLIAEIDELFPDYEQLLENIARTLQRMSIYQVTGVAYHNNDNDAGEFRALADKISAEDIQLFYQIAVLGRRDLYLAPDPRSGAEMTLLRMLTFRPASPKGSGESTPVPRKKNPRRASSSSTTSDESSKASSLTSSLSDIQSSDWVEFVPKLGLTGVNNQLVSNCSYLKQDNDTVFLRLDGRAASYLTAKRKEILEKALSDHFSGPIKVDISIGPIEDETPVQVEMRKDVEQLDAARAGLEADPNVQALQDMFDAELQPDSVQTFSDK